MGLRCTSPNFRGGRKAFSRADRIHRQFGQDDRIGRIKARRGPAGSESCKSCSSCPNLRDRSVRTKFLIRVLDRMDRIYRMGNRCSEPESHPRKLRSLLPPTPHRPASCPSCSSCPNLRDRSARTKFRTRGLDRMNRICRMGNQGSEPRSHSRILGSLLPPTHAVRHPAPSCSSCPKTRDPICPNEIPNSGFRQDGQDLQDGKPGFRATIPSQKTRVHSPTHPAPSGILLPPVHPVQISGTDLLERNSELGV